jgi:hypothetical protein
MAYLDEVQLKSLYTNRLKEGELYAPKLIYPRDIINYFIFAGNSICNQEGSDYTSIRYVLENPYPITDAEMLQDIIDRHRKVFRVTLTRTKNDYEKEGKTLKVFKAFFKSGLLLEGSNNLVCYHWQFNLKDNVNKSMLQLGGIFND